MSRGGRPRAGIADDRVRIDGEIAWVRLQCGRETCVDLADLPVVRLHGWFSRSDGKDKVYVAATIHGAANIRLHRWLMFDPLGMSIDHVDGNPLNNRRGNLRACNQTQNNANRRVTRAQAGLKGVSRQSNGNFRARVMADGHQLNLGTFPTAIEAARAYDAKALELFGEFAALNFPESAQ